MLPSQLSFWVVLGRRLGLPEFRFTYHAAVQASAQSAAPFQRAARHHCVARFRRNALSCRRQGLPGLPWCAGVPVRRACRTEAVPLAVELIEVTAQGVNGSPAVTPGCRRAQGPGSGMAGLPAGCLRTPGDPGPGGGRQPGIIE